MLTSILFLNDAEHMLTCILFLNGAEIDAFVEDKKSSRNIEKKEREKHLKYQIYTLMLILQSTIQTKF